MRKGFVVSPVPKSEGQGHPRLDFGGPLRPEPPANRGQGSEIREQGSGVRRDRGTRLV